MSAYLCEPDTFDFIATAGGRFTLGGPSSVVHVQARISMPDVPALVSEGILQSGHDILTLHTDEAQIAAVLRHQNIRSIQARYGSDADDMWGDEPYRYRRVESDLISHPAVLKSLACLEYQSCETDDYRETLAWALLEAIRDAAVRDLPGYDDAPWGWTRGLRRAS